MFTSVPSPNFTSRTLCLILSRYHDMNPNARLQTLLISRFLLNLRKSQEPPPLASRPSRITMSGFRLPTFPEIVGDIGQPLDHAVGEEEQVMEEARTCHGGRASTNTSAPCA